MLHLSQGSTASIVREASGAVEVRPSRTNEKYYVLTVAGVPVVRINKFTGHTRKIELGPRNIADLGRAGVAVSGKYIAKS